MLQNIHHVALIASDYQRSLHFYTQILGLELLQEVFRADRQSWKADLGLNGLYLLELFTFPGAPARPSYPEATGLRHLAFSVSNLESVIDQLAAHGIVCEPIRTDPYTKKRFTFLADPDQLPIELYEL
jgi:glyoxylase I family protein